MPTAYTSITNSDYRLTDKYLHVTKLHHTRSPQFNK